MAKNNSDLATLWSANPSLILTLITILLLLCLILISWGACLYGVISSCNARRRLHYYDNELERRREVFIGRLIDAVAGGGLGGKEAMGVLGEMRAEHIEWARRRERRKMRKRAGEWVRRARGLVGRERVASVFDLEQDAGTMQMETVGGLVPRQQGAVGDEKAGAVMRER